MPSVELLYSLSGRQVQRSGPIGQIFDDWLGKVAGTTPRRGASGWGISSVNYEVVSLVGVVATTGGAIAAWQPASGMRVIIRRLIADIAVISTGAANLSVGVAANATTSATNLVTASDVHSAAILLDSLTLQAAAVAAEALVMTVGQYITFSGSGSTVGMVGSALIEYWQP